MKHTVKAWAVLEEKLPNGGRADAPWLGGISVAHCRTDDEETVEIHRTRQRAKGAAFTGERVVRCTITFEKK